MTKAEKRALEKYPANKTVFDKYEKQRYAFICGYIQAEKDLELTWEDIKEIYFLFRSVLNEWYGHKFSDEGICREVLKRFKEKKGKEV